MFCSQASRNPNYNGTLTPTRRKIKVTERKIRRNPNYNGTLTPTQMTFYADTDNDGS